MLLSNLNSLSAIHHIEWNNMNSYLGMENNFSIVKGFLFSYPEIIFNSIYKPMPDFNNNYGLLILITCALLLFLISMIIILIKYTRKLKKANQIIKENARFIADQNEEIKVQFDILKRKNIELNKYREHLEKIDKRMVQKLNYALDKAQESERLKTSLISNIYHEIRTPLNAIIGFVQLLSIEEEIKNTKYIDIIEKNADDLLSLVDNLIELSNLQAGIKDLKIKELNINEFLNTIYNETVSIRNVQKKDHLDIRLEFYESVEYDIITTDSIKLYKIIRQLIDNALKYTKEGSISIGYFKDDQSAYFTISDTGIGIREDRILSIFNPFLKIEDQPNLYRGMGIGLALAKQLADLINGEIEVESKLNEGTKFTIKLPNLQNNSKHKVQIKKRDILSYAF